MVAVAGAGVVVVVAVAVAAVAVGVEAAEAAALWEEQVSLIIGYSPLILDLKQSTYPNGMEIKTRLYRGLLG
jgi:hypothetical protein